MSVEWRDICDQCHEVFDFEDDGVTSRHLCLKAELTEAMLRAAGLRKPALAVLRQFYIADDVPVWLGENADSAADALYPLIDDPRRMGPFEPDAAPPIVLVSDLLAWTREDLASLPGVGGGAVGKLEDWLRRHGHTFRSRDEALVARYRSERREDAVARRALAIDDLRRRFRDLGVGTERVVGLPEMTIDAADEVTIETSITGPFRLVNLYIMPRVAPSLTVTSLKVGEFELLENGDGIPAETFADSLGIDEFLNAPPLPDGGPVSITVRNETSGAVLFRGALFVHFIQPDDMVSLEFDRELASSQLLHAPLPFPADFRPASRLPPAFHNPFASAPLVRPPVLPPGILPPGWRDGDKP